jgi:hypothetical protein
MLRGRGGKRPERRRARLAPAAEVGVDVGLPASAGMVPAGEVTPAAGASSSGAPTAEAAVEAGAPAGTGRDELPGLAEHDGILGTRQDSPGGPGAGGSLAGGPDAGGRGRTGGGSLVAVNVIIAVFVALALALRLYQLARPGYLLSVTEYDDGPYFGSAVRLVDGSIPYHDFLLVQPPGITLLMTPAALVGKVVGTDWAIAIGRLLTVCASVTCVVLAGWLARHRGALAVIVACGLTAVYPDSIQAAHTVLVEPWLTMFCLAGAVAVFDGDRFTASRQRLVWGGVAFGFAGVVEVWAVFPLAVIVLLSLRAPRRLISYLAGAAAGFLIPVLPFAALAPRGFYQGLVTAQVGSRYKANRIVNWYRMKEMAGLTDIHVTHATAWLVAAAIAALVGGLLGGAWIVTRRLPTRLEWFCVGSAILIVAAFMWPNQFHYHFVAFLAPFIGLAIGLPAARLIQDFGTPRVIQSSGDAAAVNTSRPAAARWVQWGAVAVAGLALSAMTVVQARAETHLKSHVKYSTVTKVRKLIPAGSCVVTDEVSMTITADRFVSDVPGCPLLVDSIGTDYALSHGRDPGTGAASFPAVVQVWSYALAHAQYVWLSGREAHRVPWTPALLSYFKANFTQIMGHGLKSAVFQRNGAP